MGIVMATIEDLKEKVRHSTYEEWSKIVQGPLKSVGLNGAMAVTIDILRQYLPIFEGHNLQGIWLRGLLATFQNSIEKRSEEIPSLPIETLYSRSKGPGCGNFLYAIERLWEASELRNDANACVKQLIYALDSCILALLAAYWAELHPHEWELQAQFWREEGALNPDNRAESEALNKGLLFRLQPEAQEYQINQWLSVLDEIAKYDIPSNPQN